MVWYGYSFLDISHRSMQSHLTSSTTMGVVQWVRLQRLQFAFYIRSFCLIANHSISNGSKINLSRAIKMRKHVRISSWNGSIESNLFFFFVDEIVVTMTGRPSNQINLHFLFTLSLSFIWFLQSQLHLSGINKNEKKTHNKCSDFCFPHICFDFIGEKYCNIAFWIVF